MPKDDGKSKKVIIKWKAYVKMLKHVLRFGSSAKDKSQFKEVMGIIIGHLVDKPGIVKDVIIEDAVPISHGGHIEVAFKPEDYGSFSVIDSEYADKGWFSVGWYHSHPGLTCFFSATDVRNQMGWQGPNNSAVGIVWDHTRLGNADGDMGFEIYRLDDPQNPMSDYYKVNWIVEPPEDVNFYKEALVDLVTNLGKGEPPILELNEVPDVFGDLEVPGQSAMMSKEPELNYQNVAESLKGGIEKMSDIFVKPLLQYLNDWARGMSQAVITKNVVMLQNIKGLKDNLSKAMAELQSWFKFAVNDGLRSIWADIDDKFDANIESKKKLTEQMTKLTESISKSLTTIFNEAFDKTINDLNKQITGAMDALKTAGQNTEELSGLIESQKQAIDIVSNNYKEKSGQIKTNGMLIMADSVKTIKTGLGPLSSSLDDIQKDLTDIKVSLKALSGMVKGGK